MLTFMRKKEIDQFKTTGGN